MNHIIVCNNCKGAIELTSPYQTFCPHCNKKLPFNFQEWKKNNYDKTFEDYKEIVGIKLNLPEASSQVKKSPLPKSLMTIIGVFCGIIFFYIASNINFKDAINFFYRSNTNAELLSSEWSQIRVSGGLIISSPYEFKEADLEFPFEVARYIEKAELFQSKNKNGFIILLNSILYKPEAENLSLEGAALGSVEEAKRQEGVSDFFYTQLPYNLDNIPGIIQRGSFQKNGIELEFINTCFHKELYLYQVWVGYHKKDEVGKKAAQKVIESIKVE